MANEHPKEMVQELKNWHAKKIAGLSEISEENKMKLQELYDGDIFLLTEKSQLPKYALAKLSYHFAKADELNSNFRIYPEDLMIREIDKKSEELKKAKIPGQLDHPLSGNTELDSAMHILNNVSYNKKTKLASAESFILDTTGGRNFMTLLDAKVPIGASMRSWGTVGPDKKINPDWALQSIDFVQKPSFGANAAIDASNLIESVDSLIEEEKSMPSEETHIYTEDEIFLEARFAGVSPKDFCRKLNEIQALKRVNLESGFSEDEAKSLVREAMEAGIDMKDPEKRKTYFETVEKNRTPGELTIHEKAIGIQKKMLSEGKQENLEFIEKVLLNEQRLEEKKKVRQKFVAQWDRDIEMSNKKMTNEEYRIFINKRLKAAGYDLLEEE